jgi:hypothetical protein
MPFVKKRKPNTFGIIVSITYILYNNLQHCSISSSCMRALLLFMSHTFRIYWEKIQKDKIELCNFQVDPRVWFSSIINLKFENFRYLVLVNVNIYVNTLYT